nr:MAG TPA: hypothetical protein [Crassvirales sp.]
MVIITCQVRTGLMVVGIICSHPLRGNSPTVSSESTESSPLSL